MITKQSKKIIKDIKGDKPIITISGRDLGKQSKAPYKNGYLFNYPRPKTGKKQLPYFDENPVIIILARKGNKILASLCLKVFLLVSISRSLWNFYMDNLSADNLNE